MQRCTSWACSISLKTFFKVPNVGLFSGSSCQQLCMIWYLKRRKKDAKNSRADKYYREPATKHTRSSETANKSGICPSIGLTVRCPRARVSASCSLAAAAQRSSGHQSLDMGSHLTKWNKRHEILYWVLVKYRGLTELDEHNFGFSSLYLANLILSDLLFWTSNFFVPTLVLSSVSNTKDKLKCWTRDMANGTDE